MLKPIDIDAIRGKRNLVLTMNAESWDVGIREGEFQNVSGTLRSTKNGEVFESLNFWDGALELAHSDCVVRNCYFRNLNFHTLYQLDGAQNCLVELCTFDGRPDGAVVNASNADFVFAHNRPMTVRQCIFLDASNDSLNSVGGLMEKNIIIGGGFTAAAHADCISVHTTVDKFAFNKNYCDYTQRPGAVIPNAVIKYVTVPSIGQGQNAGNGIAHEVSARDNILIGGGYTCYLDNHSVIENNCIDGGYWFGFGNDEGDVYPGGGGTYQGNKNCSDYPDDYVSIAVGEGEEIPPGPEPEPPPEEGSPEEIAEIWEALALINESLKATNDRLELLVANLHEA